ncbi:MAG: amylo-alpha-1,6-glucosidase [Parcubacteria group bacterium]|jgi:glycogen debranching enzyme
MPILSSNIQKAYAICLHDLRSCCIQGGGILASPVNFSDYWARDTFWAALGMLKINTDQESRQVKTTLELFFKYQRADGKIPRKIALDYNGLKYLGLKICRKNPRPIYYSPIGFLFSMDDNLLLAIAFCLYVEQSRDLIFAREHFQKAIKSLEFYKKRQLLSKNLIEEKGLGNWMDTIFKKGNVLYTNCIWYESLRLLENLEKKLGMKPDSSRLPSSIAVRRSIRDKFWIAEKQYFADNLPKAGRQNKYFDLAGNLLAILFEIADAEQRENIFKKIRASKKKGDRLHRINEPLYPFWKVNPIAQIFGIGRYHNGISWSWLESLLIIAQSKFGKQEEARKNLENISEIILQNKHLHETYFLNGRPFDHLLWKSAVPFAWGAGMFLWAVETHKSTVK